MIPEEVTICAGILDDIIDSVVHEASSIVPAPVPSPVKRRRATLRHQLSQDLSVAPDTGWSAAAKLAVATTVLACCANVVFLELLVSKDPGIGNLVTFSQFLVIAVEGFIFTTKLGTVGPVVPCWVILLDCDCLAAS